LWVGGGRTRRRGDGGYADKLARFHYHSSQIFIDPLDNNVTAPFSRNTACPGNLATWTISTALTKNPIIYADYSDPDVIRVGDELLFDGRRVSTLLPVFRFFIQRTW
jgi:hypothetical protein